MRTLCKHAKPLDAYFDSKGKFKLYCQFCKKEI